VRELPMLFNTPMVQTIQNTKPNVWPPEPIDPSKPFKWQTRRVCKDIAGYDFKWGLDKEPYIGNYKVFARTDSGKWDWVTLENQWLYDLQTAVDDSRTHLLKCPYQPGDRLYVKEAIKKIEWTDGMPGISYVADDEPVWDMTRPCRWVWKNKSLPSMFMPKSIARIWLEVTDVRVERLQDITTTDILAEGVTVDVNKEPPEFDDSVYLNMQYQIVWESTIPKKNRPLYGWNANPWVWVILFRRVA